MTKHKMTVNGFRGLVTTGLVSLLVACGGSGSGGGSDDSDLASVSTEVLTQGSIQRFGSVYVNDKKYVRSANGQVITDDNPSAGEDTLRIGMRVKLRGRYNDDGTGTYDSIEVDNELKGPIATDSIDIPDPVNNPAIGSFFVLGTKVLVGDGVFFDESGGGNSINSLADLDDTSGLEDVVEVSGWFNEDGDLEALRIEKKAENLAAFLGAGRKLEVKGTVLSPGPDAMQFTYRSGLVVDYSNADIDNDLPNDPANWVNLFVESKCDPQSPNFNVVNGCFNGAILRATKVDNEAPEMAGGFQAEFEGIISDFNDLDDFKVSGYPVAAAGANIFCGNAVLGNGVKVKARGNVIKVNDVNTVDASSVECRQAKTVRLEGQVTSGGSTFTLLGITVVTNNKTERKDLGSDDPATSEFVKMRGFVDGADTVIAVRVEGDSIDPDDFIVQAPKDQVIDVTQGDDKFTLLGVIIDTSISDFEGLNDENITRAAFYQALMAGTAPAVKAKGTYDTNTNTLTAREVELEEND
ncbi:MAG: DUF5666 domain-containing protein [Gammaproteobacteria bacterium]